MSENNQIQKGTTSMEMSVSTNYDSFNFLLTVTPAKADNPVLVEALQEYHHQLCTNNKKISQHLLVDHGIFQLSNNDRRSLASQVVA
jgi:hypothetical protein